MLHVNLKEQIQANLKQAKRDKRKSLQQDRQNMQLVRTNAEFRSTGGNIGMAESMTQAQIESLNSARRNTHAYWKSQ